MLFRGYGFQVLVKGIGPFATILPVAVLFGLAHSQNLNFGPLALFNTILWGVVLGYAYLTQRRSVAAHRAALRLELDAAPTRRESRAGLQWMLQGTRCTGRSGTLEWRRLWPGRRSAHYRRRHRPVLLSAAKPPYNIRNASSAGGTMIRKRLATQCLLPPAALLAAFRPCAAWLRAARNSPKTNVLRSCAACCRSTPR